MITIKNINVQTHLNNSDRVNLGSFYTPNKYVKLVGNWLKIHGLTKNNTILDSSCGYGAFFTLADEIPVNTFIGNDIDKDALKNISEEFPFVNVYNINSLENISRKMFNIETQLIVVGNPPYNDVTSQINQGLKNTKISMDGDVKTRDLGMSFLLSYNKLEAEYVAILHPLSYLIKRPNFSVSSKFFKNYTLLEHVVFNSQEFANTSKLNGFPIIIALYKRTPNMGLCYDEVYNMKFKTVDGETFSLSNYDYVAEFIEKYPHKKRYDKEILFYTLRDINALKRSRTFIKDRCMNAVDVNPDKLGYYCYIDCFKRFADVPYYMGNFDIPFNKNAFGDYESAFIAVSKHFNPQVFGNFPIKQEQLSIAKSYISNVLTQSNRN